MEYFYYIQQMLTGSLRAYKYSYHVTFKDLIKRIEKKNE